MGKTVRTLGEFESEAARFATTLAQAEQGATLITLSGELGAGKTAFTKTVARTLGVAEVVTSPTFVLEKIYTFPSELGSRTSKFTRLVHIDAYRLESGSDLIPLAFDELMRDADVLIMLEWPERVADALPKPVIKVSIVTNADGSRTIAYE